MKITFVGHGSLIISDDIKKGIFEAIKQIISQTEKTLFLCGGYGDFDNICAKTCHDLKNDFSNIEVIFVTPYITEAQQRKIKDLLASKLYDDTIYPPIEKTPPRYAIIKRNEWMINEADLIIAYVKFSYGGAYKALNYAQKKGKRIINLANENI